MSAPLGQATVPPSRKNRRKYFTSLSGSNTGPLSQRRKSTVFVVLPSKTRAESALVLRFYDMVHDHRNLSTIILPVGFKVRPMQVIATQAAIERPRSFGFAPIARSDRKSRSIETDASPRSILATRD